MNTTVNYEFCDDIWGVIKSFMFDKNKLKSVGDKCDCCNELWSKTLCFRKYDVYYEIKGDYKIREYGNIKFVKNTLSKHNEITSICGFVDYPYNVEIKKEETKNFQYLCDKCWIEESLSYYTRELRNYDTIKGIITTEILKYLGDDKKTNKFIDNLLYAGDGYKWLLKKHRVITRRNLQAKIIEFIEDAVKNYNKEVKNCMKRKIILFEEQLEKRKKYSIRDFWRPLNKEQYNRELLKKFNQGKINYTQLMNSLN
jgi:hypothetical protein